MAKPKQAVAKHNKNASSRSNGNFSVALLHIIHQDNDTEHQGSSPISLEFRFDPFLPCAAFRLGISTPLGRTTLPVFENMADATIIAVEKLLAKFIAAPMEHTGVMRRMKHATSSDGLYPSSDGLQPTSFLFLVVMPLLLPYMSAILSSSTSARW